MLTVAANSSVWVPGFAMAQPARIDENDALAQVQGYKHNGLKSQRFKSRGADEKCNNCALYQGGKGDAWGGCLFFGKQASAIGLCHQWAKRH